MKDKDLSFFRVKGTSMRPCLWGGEKLIIKKVAIDAVIVGDIISYKRHNQLVCHRAIKKDRKGQQPILYARGDNCWGDTDCVTEEMLQGKAIAVVKGEKTIDLTGTWQTFFGRIMVYLSMPITCVSKIVSLFRRCLSRHST